MVHALYRSALCAICLLLAVGRAALPDGASAEAPIRYIATSGNDANGCGQKAPCRSLQRGIDATPLNGELRVLNSGIYGRGTVDKSMTLSGGGNTVFGEIHVKAPDAVVAIRDFNLNGKASRKTGIYVVAAAAVHIERCTVERYAESGITSYAEAVELTVSDSISRDNGGAGLDVQDGTTGVAKVVVDNSRLLNNHTDGALLYMVAATITRSTLAGNRGHGIALESGKADISRTTATGSQIGFQFSESTANLEWVSAVGNGAGILSLDATVSLSNSTIANNSRAGVFNADGTVLTRGNNIFANNNPDLDGSNPLTPLDGV